RRICHLQRNCLWEKMYCDRGQGSGRDGLWSLPVPQDTPASSTDQIIVHIQHAAYESPYSESLGQPRSNRRSWLRTILVVGLAQVARLHRSALHRLRACERLDWNQWRSSNECQCKRAYPDANVPREGRGARKGLQTLWYQSLPDSALQCTYRDWWIENRRPL